jgi:hypothetical protein
VKYLLILLGILLASSAFALHASEETSHDALRIANIITTEPYFVTVKDNLIIKDCIFKQLNVQGSGKIYLINVTSTFLNVLEGINICIDPSSQVMFRNLNLREFPRNTQFPGIIIIRDKKHE